MHLLGVKNPVLYIYWFNYMHSTAFCFPNASLHVHMGKESFVDNINTIILGLLFYTFLNEWKFMFIS